MVHLEMAMTTVGKSVNLIRWPHAETITLLIGTPFINLMLESRTVVQRRDQEKTRQLEAGKGLFTAIFEALSIVVEDLLEIATREIIRHRMHRTIAMATFMATTVVARVQPT